MNLNANMLDELRTRLHRLERQNRILMTILCAAAGIGLVAATSHSGVFINAAEIRAQRIILIDNHGKALVDTQGVDGAEVHAFLPHDVIQR